MNIIIYYFYIKRKGVFEIFPDIIKLSEKYFQITPTDISLKDTFECGQCFRWNDDGNGYIGVAYGKAVRFIQGDGCIYIKGADVEDIENIWLKYLSLDVDYSDVVKRFDDDEYIKKASQFGKGIRILRQEPCEATISFIISSNNNIKRIKKIIEHFCMLFGDPIEFEGKTLYTFPTNDSLKKISVEENTVMNCKPQIPQRVTVKTPLTNFEGLYCRFPIFTQQRSPHRTTMIPAYMISTAVPLA